MEKVYKTNFSRGCFHHWSASKAIAEYISNWLDSDGEQEHYFGDDYISLTNKNIEVSTSILMMGLSDKRSDDSKRGQFGLGAVQGLVVLTDLGCSVEIINNKVKWVPSYEFCENFEEDVLVIKEDPFTPTGNFTVIVSGLSEDILDEVKQRCLEFQQREVLFSTKYGDVIAHGEDNGEIFCGDMYVCENSSFKYSYNFAPKVLPLNQDRNSADQWEISRLTAKIWKQCPDKELLVEAIKSKKADCEYVMDSWYTSDSSSLSVSEEFGEEFIEKYDNHIVTSDFAEYEELAKCGNKVKYLDNSNQVKAIKESTAYSDMIASMEIIEVESTRTKVERIVQAFQQLIVDHDQEELVYEGFTMQEHIDTLDEIIYEL